MTWLVVSLMFLGSMVLCCGICLIIHNYQKMISPAKQNILNKLSFFCVFCVNFFICIQVKKYNFPKFFCLCFEKMTFFHSMWGYWSPLQVDHRTSQLLLRGYDQERFIVCQSVMLTCCLWIIACNLFWLSKLISITFVDLLSWLTF